MKKIKITKEQFKLLKENFPKVTGGLNRVDKLFKSTFTEQEETPHNNIGPVNYHKVAEDFLHFLYKDEIEELVRQGRSNLNVDNIKYPDELKGLSYEDLTKELENDNILIKDYETGKYVVSSALNKLDAIIRVKKILNTLLNKGTDSLDKSVYNLKKQIRKIYENHDFVIEKFDDGKCNLKYKDNNEVHEINSDILKELKNIYEKDKKLINIIENEFPELWDKVKKSISEPTKKTTEKKSREELIAKIKDIRQKELDKRKEEEGLIYEVTTSASSGQFTAPLFGEPIKRKEEKEEVPVVYETTQGSDSIGQYDANALINIGRDGKFKSAKKTNAQKKTQYPDGGFVEFNDCVKLNNKPAGSGCSSGAIDNVVRVKKTKGNIISPSLNESINNEIEFNNWVTPDETTLKREFKVEHTLKKNNFFESEEEFLNAVENGSIITLTDDEDKGLIYRSRTKTKDSLLGLIRTYGSYPEFRNEDTVEAIYDGYKNNTEMELPIVIEFSNGKRRIFTGNTRLDIAFQLGVEPKVLLIKSDVEF
jgi:hypothetical protein